MGRELLALGVLTTVDRAALAAYCVAYARWADAEAQVTKLGTVVKTANGNLIQNPYLAVANRAMDQMMKAAGEFGMTPSSRSRMQVEQADAGPSLADVAFGDVLDDGEGDDEDDAPWQNRIVGEGEVAAVDLVPHPQNWRKHPASRARCWARRWAAWAGCSG